MMMVFIVGFYMGVMFTAMGLLICMHHNDMKQYN